MPHGVAPLSALVGLVPALCACKAAGLLYWSLNVPREESEQSLTGSLHPVWL